MMQRIRMLSTERGSPDGLTVSTYLAGREYDVPDALLMAFIDMGACEIVDGLEAKVMTQPETKPMRKIRGRK